MKVLALFKNPAPYIDPLFRLWSQNPEIDLTVAYCLRTTDGNIVYDPSVGKYVKWGTKLLQGYKFLFLEKEMGSLEKNDLKISNPEIKKYIGENDFDIILIGTSYWSPTTWMAINVAKRRKIPMITRMTVETQKKRSVTLHILKKIIVGKYCRQMSAGVYECRQQKEYLEYYGMQSDKLFFAPCAADNNFFLAQSAKYNKVEIRRTMKIADEKVVFVTTGNLNPRKRQTDVITALVQLKKKGVEPYYYMVGNGPSRAEIEEQIRKHELKNVYITGQLPQDEMSKYLKMADAYILPSENDASPKALNEAMNFELPIIITTGVGTAEQLLKEGENGYIYSPGEVDHLADIMERIVTEHKDIREQMGKLSKNIVGQYDYTSIANSWTKACKYALKTNQKKNEQRGGKIHEC